MNFFDRHPHLERFTPTYGSFRVGDVRASRADIGKAVRRVEERRLKATAHLFTYCEGDYLIALPLLFRSTGEVRRGWKDATSVYGYSGPVASHERTPVPIVYNFQAALREVLVEQRVITVFSRLHPLNAQHDLLAGLGECRTVGQTVSIDLTLPLEKQRAQYRGTYKRLLNGQRRESSVACLHDEEKRHLSDFVSIYAETMRRVKAAHTWATRSWNWLKRPSRRTGSHRSDHT